MEYPLADMQEFPEQRVQWLRRCPVFNDWPADRLRELARASRVQCHARRTRLQGRDILLVVEGSLEITATNHEGDKHVLAVSEPGHVAQLVELLDGGVPRLYGYHAREDSTVLHIPSAAMERILDAEPMLWRGVARFVLRRYALGIEVRQSQVLGSLRRRLATALFNLASRYGDLAPDACNTDLHIAQAELADMLGVARQSVGRELRRLEKEGVLGAREGYRSIAVLDVPALLRIARPG